MAINEPCIFDERGKWSKHNIYLSMAIMREHKISRITLAILEYIIESYNSKKFCDYDKNAFCSISYKELGEKLGTKPIVISRSLKQLLEKKLITIVNEKSRAGRGAYEYKPNYRELNAILKDYLRDNPDDKKT